ncbi:MULTISPECIES: cytochrome P450 [unclassified Streptomyces]|uniref:cytochrome P450 n=1 Tax=unclassified Streptomyces TaxID=2593676 RepID=UPI00190684BA|nr:MULTISPECIES: cytochrome P450 [unclassified Streptomyces]MCU4749199.1 cytochrome P450 [Streptomyces sp. G-5]QQN77260.1 cytochrome P450 [Streptomyces sp. XC 2026]
MPGQQEQQAPSEHPEQQELLTFPFASTGLEFPPVYHELYQQRLTKVRLPYGDDAYLAIRYADVKTVLSDSRFSIVASLGQDQPRTRAGARVGNGLFSLDPPQHSRLRSVLGRDFTPRRVEKLRERVRELTDQCLDRMEAAGSPADLVAHLAVPMPTAVVCEMMGVPEPDHHLFWGWAETILSNDTTPDDLIRRYQEFTAYMGAMVEERRARPTDDMFGMLVRACDEEGRITEIEMHALASDLLSAGFVSTAHQIANFSAMLLARPERLQPLVDKPEQIPAAVEELMRHVPILSGFSFPRYATEDLEMSGVTVRRGEAVIPVIAAANRDPDVYPDAGRLDLERNGLPHLGFGQGPHFCIGAHLARVELQVVLEALTERFPDLRFGIPENALKWKRGHFMNGLHELPVAW